MVICHQGSIRWKLTDNLTRWTRLESYDKDFLTGLAITQLGHEPWAVLNVLSVIMPRKFLQGSAYDFVFPDTVALVYETSPEIQQAVGLIVKECSWAFVVPLCECGVSEGFNHQ